MRTWLAELGARSFWVFLMLLLLPGASSAADAGEAASFVSRLNIQRSGGEKISLDTSEGDFPTFSMAANEEMEIALTVPQALAGQWLRVRADDGGVLRGGSEKNSLFPVTAQGGEGILKMSYVIGGARGRYSLKISAPGYLQTLEFWVGEPWPQARPGPRRSFSNPLEKTSKLPNPPK